MGRPSVPFHGITLRQDPTVENTRTEEPSPLNPDRSTQLLYLLKSHFNDPEATFSSRPKRLSGGVFSEVYGFSLSSEGRRRQMVLRLYAAGTDPIQPKLEQAVQDGLAEAIFRRHELSWLTAIRIGWAECL